MTKSTNLFSIILKALIVLTILMYTSTMVLADETDKDASVYKSATEYDYPPFSVTENGEAEGFSVDLLKAVAQEMGIEMSFKIDEWHIIKSELENGELDVLPLVGQSEEREAYFDFSVPYIVMRGNVFVRKGEKSIRTEQDLIGKSIIVMEGDNSEEYARSIGLSETLVIVPTYVDAFVLLSEGQHDALLAQGLVGEKIINDLEIRNVEPLYSYDDSGQTRVKVQLTGYEQKFCFAVKDGDKELLAKLNEGLAIVSENGTYDELYKKWFPFLISEQPSFEKVIKYILIAFIPILILVLLTSVYTIKQQVKSKTKELTDSWDILSFERNKYYSTLVAMGEGVMVVDQEGVIEVINPAALKMLKLDRDETVGENYRQILYFKSTVDETIFIDPIREVIINEETYSSQDQVLILVGKDKNYYVEVKATRISNEKNDTFDVVIVFTDVSKMKKHMNQIEYLSFHDSLTNLYNRRFFEEEMKRLDNFAHYPLTIVMADINGLKLVNDAFGHLAGDEMLKEAAKILKQECRSNDIVSRWGGDEFVIIFPSTDPFEVDGAISRIKSRFEESDYSFGILSMSFGHDTKRSEEESIETVFKNAEEFMYRQKVSETEGIHGETIRMILNTLFEKSPLDKEHCQRVSDLAVALAEKMHLHQSKIADIRSIGLVHDIGKIMVPQHILDKPSKLTEEEFEEVKKHPLTGYKMLNTTNEFSHIAKVVLQHHERVDGKGYPEGIKGASMSMEAKIISVVDAYDAMTSSRPYRKKVLTKEKAAKEIIKNVGTQFDEEVAKIFVKEVLGVNI